MGAARVVDFRQAAMELELSDARAEHERALAKRDRDAIAKAARRIWAVLRHLPRNEWLNRPAGRW